MTLSASLTSIEELNDKLKGLMPDAGRVCIGIDGTDGSGKTTLARKLAPLLAANLISLDDYLDKKRGTYVPYINCEGIRAAIETSATPILIEGVCLRGVAERCGITVHIHVYVRSLSENSGLWHEEDMCLGETPVDELKQRERELRIWAARMSGREGEPLEASTEDVQRAAEEIGLRDELINYHARWKPVQNADVVFDVIV